MLQRLLRELPGLAEALEPVACLTFISPLAHWPARRGPHLFSGKKTASSALQAAAAILPVIENWQGQSPDRTNFQPLTQAE